MYDIIISGVTGFVGSNYMRYFSNLGYKVLGLSRTAHPPKELLAYGDYLSVDLLDSIPKMKGKVMLHCAGLASDKLGLDILMKSNCEGTKRIFEAVDVDHFIQISSASVYPPNSQIHSEQDDIDKALLSDYGLSKLRADEYLKGQMGKGTKITILRPRAIYGIGDRVLLPRILQLQKFNSLIFPGKLQYEISLTNIHNLMNITSKVMKDKQYDFEIFNICDNFTYRLDRIVSLLVKRIKQKGSLKIVIPESVIYGLGRLFPQSNLNTTAMKYFLCNHQISNEKAIAYFKLDLEFNFYNYLPRLIDWVQQVGQDTVITQDNRLPWIE